MAFTKFSDFPSTSPFYCPSLIFILRPALQIHFDFVIHRRIHVRVISSPIVMCHIPPQITSSLPYSPFGSTSRRRPFLFFISHFCIYHFRVRCPIISRFICNPNMSIVHPIPTNHLFHPPPFIISVHFQSQRFYLNFIPCPFPGFLSSVQIVFCPHPLRPGSFLSLRSSCTVVHVRAHLRHSIVTGPHSVGFLAYVRY